MTLAEAMEISNRLLPGEPGADELENWRASRPPPEPPRRERSLDTAPAPAAEIDWAAVIRGTILGERAFMTEAIGGAIGEYGDGLLAEVETAITQAVNKVRSELRVEISRQLHQLRADFTAQATELFESVALIHSQGEQLKAQLEAIIAKKKRAKPLLLPAPNGNDDAHPQ